ncbi:hypothetical protein RHMOL_Rhmol02G0190600 [Rhododendron molle]|nr:hypothetical protein RHMOL_Rhmol02G0190600 [Rhododendron molle]KAI8568341.1 hypothetical protein RHMOL_Rhmol02G0190600 [Rhododendron molle]
MKDHYEALVEAGKDPYEYPYKGVSGEDWAWMIGNIWTNKDKEVLVLKRKKVRSKVPFNHTMGSQSFASAMAAQTHKRGGQRPHIADFYSSTHYNQKKKKWAAPICEQLHLLLEARQKEDEARCPEADALGLPITMPKEEMLIEVLGKKFYVKEYGVSLKSSSSKWSSGQSHEEVRVLKNEVETLKDVCKQQNDQLLLEARQKEDEARCPKADALGLPITMPKEEMLIEVLSKKFYVKEYGVSLKSSSSKWSSGQSPEEVRVLKNEVETLKDVCKQQNDQLLTLSAFGDTKLGPVSGWEWFSESPICVEVRVLPGERKIVQRHASVTVVGWVNAFIGRRWPELEIVEVSGSCVGGAVRGSCEIWLA